MSPAHIRQVVAGDLQKLLELYSHFPREDDPVSDDAVERAWAEILERPGMHVYVVETGEQLVASCTLVVVPNLRRATRPYGLMELVVTHTEHRRRGHGTAVLRHALDAAWGLGCYKVMLLTGRKDEGTLRFYDRSGFERGSKTGYVAVPPSA